MKKFVMGVIIGAMLSIGVSTAADSISKIGKTITNEYVVKMDGSSLDVKAIAVDGTSYAPVRAIAEAAGFAVDFQNGEVLLVGTDEGSAHSTTRDISVDDQIKSLLYGIEARKSNIEVTKEQLKTADPRHHEALQNNIEKLEREIQEYETELAELQEQQ